MGWVVVVVVRCSEQEVRRGGEAEPHTPRQSAQLSHPPPSPRARAELSRGEARTDGRHATCTCPCECRPRPGCEHFRVGVVGAAPAAVLRQNGTHRRPAASGQLCLDGRTPSFPGLVVGGRPKQVLKLTVPHTTYSFQFIPFDTMSLLAWSQAIPPASA